MEHFRYKRRYNYSARTGFTLVELLVVLGIITVVTVVTINSQSSFNKSLILTNTAYDVALSLRSAQTFGLGSRALDATKNAGYGLHFQSGTPNSFTLFADSIPGPNANNCHGLPAGGISAPDAQPGNCVYDNSSERIVDYTFGNGITVSNFCVYALGSWSCSAGSGGLTSLDVVFVRPNPDPFISVNGTYSLGYPITKACLSFTSPQGGSRSISIGVAGDINASSPSCP